MARRKTIDPLDEVLNILPGVIIILLFYLYTRTGNLSLIGTVYVFILLILFGIGFYLFRKRKKMLVESGIKQIDTMDGKIFEHLLLEHFRRLGYKGKLTVEMADYGADLLLQKNSIKYVVQAKRWKSNVGIKAVQEVIGAIRYYGADKGMVITNSSFTKNARNLARTNKVELWDRKKLIDFLIQARGDNYDEGVTTELKADPLIYYCPRCGEQLVVRNGKRGLFYGCKSFPKCRYTEDYSS